MITTNGAVRVYDSTTECVETVDGSAIDGFPCEYPAGLGKLKHPLLEWSSTHMHHMFASPDPLTFLFGIGDNHTLFCWG